MVDERFMRIAVYKAREGIEKGQEPFGACVVRGEEVISCAHNTVCETMDVTAHAEMNAIRQACIKLGTTDLSGCDVYATYMPCQMCQGACEKAKISRVYYGVGRDEAEIQPAHRKVEITGNVLRDECLELVRERIEEYAETLGKK